MPFFVVIARDDDSLLHAATVSVSHAFPARAQAEVIAARWRVWLACLPTASSITVVEAACRQVVLAPYRPADRTAWVKLFSRAGRGGRPASGGEGRGGVAAHRGVAFDSLAEGAPPARSDQRTPSARA